MGRYSVLKGLYDLEKTIGCGGFAKVKLATHLATGEKVAIKIMEKLKLGQDLPRVKLEIEAMKNLRHPHICKLYQVIETESYIYMVIEYCPNGELFDHIVDKNKLTEPESRAFFRQIVSAVAYLHSNGYAHRDLKPENVLLDKNENLKLIDFGLCAKPDGGVLFTSCGSPTYAAPELVLGKQYFGSEIDVWSMGVLLFALLAGFLPFDDQNIENLYKKILKGSYVEPEWMSVGSKKLIKSMLQVDPKKRIKVTQLLSHPWLTIGILDPVKIISETIQKDTECLNLMSSKSKVSPEDMWESISNWNYDYTTATYLLLLNRKSEGMSLKLNFVEAKSPKLTPVKIIETSPETPRNFVEPRKPSSIRKPLKRIRTPNLDGDHSPIPMKITPGKNVTNERVSTPSRTRTSVLDSIEKSFNAVRHVLTPKRGRFLDMDKVQLDSNTQPNLVQGKGLCNLSTTNSNNPDQVLDLLKQALAQKGVQCTQKGYRLRGKFDDHKEGSCSFELEVCLIPCYSGGGTPQVGIRRKRLRGDAWKYKNVCEEVLALTATDLK